MAISSFKNCLRFLFKMFIESLKQKTNPQDTNIISLPEHVILTASLSKGFLRTWVVTIQLATLTSSHFTVYQKTKSQLRLKISLLVPLDACGGEETEYRIFFLKLNFYSHPSFTPLAIFLTQRPVPNSVSSTTVNRVAFHLSLSSAFQCQMVSSPIGVVLGIRQNSLVAINKVKLLLI